VKNLSVELLKAIKWHTFSRIGDCWSAQKLASYLDWGIIELFTDLHGSSSGPRKDGAEGAGLSIGEFQRSDNNVIGERTLAF
jgi:hypothetical protein